LVFYDEYNNFLGADKESLEFFNCKDIYDFNENIGDIANLFVKKEGYIYKFENYNWIDFVNYSEESIKKVLISINGDVSEVDIKINEIFPIININNSSVIYGIEFKNAIKVEDDKSFKTTNSSTKKSLEEPSSTQSNITIDIDKNSKSIEIDDNFYKELLVDFVGENNKYVEIIKNSIIKNDYDNIEHIVSILKSISTNLNLNDLIPVLNAIDENAKHKNYKNIENFLEIYEKKVNLIKYYMDKNS